MRHRVAHRKLGRVTEHRIAMLRNQAHALLKHERIETTVPRAKELRPFVERIISIAKRGVAGGGENGRSLHARRLVLRDIQDREIVSKLFDTLAPRFEARPGRHPGYTSFYDPDSDEWYDFPTRDCFPSIGGNQRQTQRGRET